MSFDRKVFEIPTDDEITSAVNTLMFACHGRAWNAGWYHNPETGDPIERNFGEMIALMHSELSEALEGHRKSLMDDKLPQHPMVLVELHDALIRIFDYLGRHHMLSGHAMAEKLNYNANRPDHKPENRVKNGGKKY